MELDLCGIQIHKLHPIVRSPIYWSNFRVCCLSPFFYPQIHKRFLLHLKVSWLIHCISLLYTKCSSRLRHMIYSMIFSVDFHYTYIHIHKRIHIHIYIYKYIYIYIYIIYVYNHTYHIYYYIILYYIIVYFIILYYIILYHIILYHIISYYIISY